MLRAMMNTSVSCEAEIIVGFDGTDRYIGRVSFVNDLRIVLAEACSVSYMRMKVVTRLFRPSQSLLVAEDFLSRALGDK